MNPTSLKLRGTRKLRDGFFLTLGIAIIVWSFYAFWNKPIPRLEGINIEIADTNAERMQGLSGRESLETGRGILFIFPESGLYGFWMKDMNFSIDIIWLNGDLQPIGIEKNISPDSYPQVFYPPVPVKYVLEVNAGESNVLELNQ